MRNLVFILLFVLFGQGAGASHLLGGEISYRCLGNGQYRFRVVVFRDCSGIPFNQAAVTLQGPVPVNCPLIGSYDATPTASTTGPLRCNPPSTFGGGAVNKGGIGKFVYEGTANLSSLGVAPANGFTWNITGIPCCRNTSNNMNCSGDIVLRITMYSFVNASGVALTPAQMCDNSPIFLEDPAAVTILNPFDTAVFNNFAQDLDVTDDVRFYVDYPWNGVGTSCQFTAPYSLASPLPGLLFPGQPAVDSITGVITYRPITAGAFNLAIRAESRRCGQKISEIFRDFQLNIINNPAGAPNPYNPNLPALNRQFTQKAPIFVPLLFDANGDPNYEIEIYAEDALIFPLVAYDVFPLFSGVVADPTTWVYSPDTVAILVTGPQMGANGTSTTTGCLYPPCATISQAGGGPPEALRFSAAGEILGYGYKGEQYVSAQLNWTPTCSNLPDSTLSACGSGLSSYQFGAVSFDDNFPLRGKNSQVYTVKVRTLPELDKPVLRTVSVGTSNNAVTLTWSQPMDTVSIDPLDSINYAQFSTAIKRSYSVNRRYSSFVGFRIYRAQSPAGPYVVVGQTNTITDTFFVDNTVVPNTQYYYYVVTLSGCSNKESDPSEVVKTVSSYLTNNVSAGLAELRWDSLGLNSPFPATGTPVVFIEREVYTQNAGFWDRMDTVAGVYTWDQSVVVCNDSVNYRAGYLDSSGVISYSWISGDVFQDNFAPDQVEVVQASVDNVQGVPYLSWTASPSLDVNRYVIYRIDNSTTPASLFFIDTVFGYSNTFWYDTFSGQNPYNSTLYYGIAAMDSCGNLGLVSVTHNTVHLQVAMNQCTSSMELSWNQYGGWGSDVVEYEVYRQDGAGAPFQLLTTVAANQSTYAFEDNQNLIQDTIYCYEIRAIRNDDSTAISNMQCVQAEVIEFPMLTYIRKVSVDTLTGQLSITFISDVAASTSKFVLERGTSASDFSRIAEFPVSVATINGPAYEVTYTDVEAKAGERSYTYRVLVYDICDQLFDTSQVASNMFLQGVPGIDFTNQLKWNDYDSWLGGVENYTILRHIPSTDPGYLPLNTRGFGSPVYNDDIKDFTDNDGNYLYFIQALEGNTNPLGLKDTVTSNIVTVIQQPRIFFPNAFLPLGLNREFRGKGVFIEENSGFNMQIYNRWGEKLFESNDFTLGWDGRAPNSEVVMPGVYVYVVNFLGKNNKTYSQKGTLTVMR